MKGLEEKEPSEEGKASLLWQGGNKKNGPMVGYRRVYQKGNLSFVGIGKYRDL